MWHFYQKVHWTVLGVSWGLKKTVGINYSGKLARLEGGCDGPCLESLLSQNCWHNHQSMYLAKAKTLHWQKFNPRY